MSEADNKMALQAAPFRSFENLKDFTEAVESAIGHALDLTPVIALHTDFLEASDQYLLLNIKEYGAKRADNLLFLSEDKVYILSGNCPSLAGLSPFKHTLAKPFGRSTVLCFLVFDKIMENHKKQIELFIDKIRKQEEAYNHTEYRELSIEFERFDDRLEELHELILQLQERRYQQVQTQYLSFDYRILIAESLSLQARCRRRIANLKEVRPEHEMLATEELNTRILKLNDVLKRLTALTVIFMLPTLIASHFGMNFQFMPELKVPWVYPAVIVGQIVIVVAGFVLFKKIACL